jgi:predicted P-loop ATPase
MEDFKGRYKNQFNYIVSNYEFRFNTVTNDYEYIKLIKGKKIGDWECYEDRVKNNILIEMHEKDLEISPNKFNLFIESETVSKDYNPFEEYFQNLKPWDQKTDYFSDFCKTIRCDDPERLHAVMKKFLIGSLDCLLVEDSVNDVCLVFQSGQGSGKSRWMRALLPKEFRSKYLFEGSIDTRNKDHVEYLSKYWFIHLDELEVLKSGEISAIKSYITRQRISHRKAFGRYTSRMERRASFLGSVNDTKFLTDITGNRRWLVFTIQSANYDHDVDIDGLWSQMYFYWKEGFQHWFDLDEIKAINQVNERYREMSSEEEQLLQLFSFPDNINAAGGNWYSSTDLIMSISLTRTIFAGKLDSNKMGRALSKHGKHKKINRGVQRYFAYFEGEDKNEKDRKLPDEAIIFKENEQEPTTKPQPSLAFDEGYDDMPF